MSSAESSPPVWLVSACLAGAPCRYDGQSANAAARSALDALAGMRQIAVCPEELGGLPTPRPPAQLVDGDGEDVWRGTARVVTRAGGDVTDAFRAGAQRAVALALEAGATHACLKARSPSCGVGAIHGATELHSGDGVTAALLKRAGLHVLTDEEVEAYLAGNKEHEATTHGKARAAAPASDATATGASPPQRNAE